ncbi:MAG: hypothetical protein MUF62_09000 [Chitinophagaceae bacterium]|nr:hypothetical protein [Chitinophagaceae bacterium]
MQKQLFLRLLCVLLPGIALAQETKVQITDKIAISFPEKPAVRDIQGVATLHTLRLSDSTANFNVLVNNLEKSNGFTADVLAAALLEPEFWEQAEQSFVAQLGAGSSVQKKEINQLDGGWKACRANSVHICRRRVQCKCGTQQAKRQSQFGLARQVLRIADDG